MRLDDERESNNIEDRRDSAGGFVGGVGRGIPFAYFSGFNPLSLISGSNNSTHINRGSDNKEAVFIKKVLASTEDVWSRVLPKYGIRYACGMASAQMGPFYCPADQKVYLDLSFFKGHHIQNLLGTLNKVQRLKQSWGGSKRKANALQVRVELQADCYAGIWGHYADKEFHQLESGDVQEAIQAAGSIGDDTLQKQATGYVRPDTFTHGTSAQRVEWFKRGFISGDLKQCNTFTYYN